MGPGTIAGHHPPSGDHANLISGSLDGQDLATGAVTASKLAGGSVVNSKLATGAVTGDKVLGDSLTGAQIDETTLNGSQITGVDASTVGGKSASSFPSQLTDLGQGSLDGSNSGSDHTLFGGVVPNIGDFKLHCQTGAGNAWVGLAAPTGQSIPTVYSLNGSAASHIVSDSGFIIPLADPSVLVWQIRDQAGTEVATLTLSFEIGDFGASKCSFAAQLLTTS